VEWEHAYGQMVESITESGKLVNVSCNESIHLFSRRSGRLHEYFLILPGNGQGVETLPDGTIRHEGLWVNDQPLVE
jgi:hypothetical protein